MISSAVVVPEDQAPALPSPNSLKRRQSSFSTDSSKRPRLETEYSQENGTTADTQSPDRRKSSAPSSAVEEKKRGKRLFGALLGTLSQTSSKPAHRKRDEIEQRQRDRVRKDTLEREEDARRKREDLNRIRKVEQQTWDEQSARLQHRNMRAMANFLQTKTEPRLYYRPWDLRPGEERQIQKQLEDVEDVIRADSSNRNASERPMNGTVEQQSQDRQYSDVLSERGDQPAESEQARNTTSEKHSPATEVVQDAPLDAERTEPPKEDDQGGGELVEGREDDVMY